MQAQQSGTAPKLLPDHIKVGHLHLNNCTDCFDSSLIPSATQALSIRAEEMAIVHESGNMAARALSAKLQGTSA